MNQMEIKKEREREKRDAKNVVGGHLFMHSKCIQLICIIQIKHE